MRDKLTWITNCLVYGGLTREQFYSVSHEIKETNRKNACMFTSLGIVLLTISLCVSFGSASMMEKRTVYALLDITYVLIVLVNLTVAKLWYPLTAFTGLLLQASLLGWGIYDALVTNPDQPTTLFLPFVALVPLLFTFPPMVNGGLTLSAMAAYLLLMHFSHMTSELMFMNSLHVILFSILGIGMGIYMSCVKLRSHFAAKQNLQFARVEREAAEARMQSEYEKSQKEMMEQNLEEVNALNSQLSIALATAQQASNAKTLFLNSMSHDIRTPMNAIIGFTALASAHIDHKEAVLEYLSKISASSDHLLSLINDVLDMSRIECGKVKIEEREVHLPDAIHDLKNIISPSIINNSLDLFIDTMDVVNEDVICDKLRLNQILLNIISNAVKFNRPGGSVAIRVSEVPGAPRGFGDYVFRIQDSGIGMSEEFREHIFENFSREQTSTVSGIQGTGLGMAITKNIVDLMGGTIEVTSEVGKGTEVTVRLRFRINGSPVRCDKIPELESMRALVVDDDLNTCASVTKMLTSIGMRSEWSSSGREALFRTRVALDSNDPFRVFIVDWTMPEMQGVQVVHRLRELAGPDCPIIILSASDWAEIEETAREAGATSFCSKPLFLSELREILLRPFCEEEKPEEEKVPDFTGRRLLLVEDNAMNQEIAVTILEEYGFVMDVASDGTEAVDKIKNAAPGQYELILMDIQMPVMNGYEATRAIRAMEDPERGRIPIFAMTANAFEEDRQRAFEAGMNGYIPKPIDVPEMLQILSEVLDA